MHDTFSIVESTSTDSGMAKSSVLVIAFEDGVRAKVKWKDVPSRGDAINNSPRKEVAAYALQKLVLPESDWVVPPTVIRCVPLSVFEDAGLEAQPRPPKSTCRLGTISWWIDNIEPGDKPLDTERLASDPLYQWYAGDVALMGYLMRHLDSHDYNVPISTDPDDPRLFLIDNGLAFNTNLYNWFGTHLGTDLRVTKLPKHAVERMRALDEEDVESIAVVADLRRDADGVFRPHAPTAQWVRHGAKVTRRRATFGLHESEVDNVLSRIEEVLAKVDSGELQIIDTRPTTP